MNKNNSIKEQRNIGEEYKSTRHKSSHKRRRNMAKKKQDLENGPANRHRSDRV